MNDRLPAHFATYKGDARSILDDGRKGPNARGEWLYPVTAEYDTEAGTTRVGFTYLAPVEVSA